MTREAAASWSLPRIDPHGPHDVKPDQLRDDLDRDVELAIHSGSGAVTEAQSLFLQSWTFVIFAHWSFWAAALSLVLRSNQFRMSTPLIALTSSGTKLPNQVFPPSAVQRLSPRASKPWNRCPTAMPSLPANATSRNRPPSPVAPVAAGR